MIQKWFNNFIKPRKNNFLRENDVPSLKDDATCNSCNNNI